MAKATAKKATAKKATTSEISWDVFNKIRLDFVDTILAQKEIADPNNKGIEKAYGQCEALLGEMKTLSNETGKWGQWVRKAERMMANFDRASKYRKAALAAKKEADKAAKATAKAVKAA